jgi:hypothetical protein
MVCAQKEIRYIIAMPAHNTSTRQIGQYLKYPEPDKQMNTIKHLVRCMLLIAGLSAVVAVHAQDTVTGDTPVSDDNSSDTPATDVSPDTSTTRMSQQGHYRVSYQSLTEPIPLNRIHSWTLHLETADGEAVDDAQIAVYGGMPVHKHGFPTAPRVTQGLGNGDYRVEGLKFSMAGHWELWLNIRAGGQTDKAVIHVILP